MKIKIILLVVLTFLSCSSDDNTVVESQEEPLIIELVTNNTNVTIDEVVTFQVKTNKPFGSITYSTDNFITSKTVGKSLGDSFGTSLTLYVNTANIGKITHSIEVSDANNPSKKAKSSLSFTVEKGNAVRIKDVLVNSFYDKDNIWDTEFSNTDPNRLADVFFVLQKPQIGTLTGQFQQQLWYKSNVKENQGDLKWDLLQDNLYVNPNAIIQLGLADDDGGGIAQDLLLGPPYEKDINLSQYISTKPDNIIFEDNSINLDVDFGLEW
ncbi:hypothetical protein ACQY1Q_08495 [Tenacibaculum sp. TC6]|uniref:hypothetical protein n=1 Tax=Tenacibaculum sp. TC6 TaxID=3423223 RepID=UPI003D367049